MHKLKPSLTSPQSALPSHSLFPHVVEVLDRLDHTEGVPSLLRDALTRAARLACESEGGTHTADEIQAAVDAHLVDAGLVGHQMGQERGLEITPGSQETGLATVLNARQSTALTIGARFDFGWARPLPDEKIRSGWWSRLIGPLAQMTMDKVLVILCAGAALASLASLASLACLGLIRISPQHPSEWGAWGFLVCLSGIVMLPMIILKAREWAVENSKKNVVNVADTFWIRWAAIPPCRAYVNACLAEDGATMYVGDVNRLKKIEAHWKASRKQMQADQQMAENQAKAQRKNAHIQAMFEATLPLDKKARRAALAEFEQTLRSTEC
jgi:hypothetical protein